MYVYIFICLCMCVHGGQKFISVSTLIIVLYLSIYYYYYGWCAHVPQNTCRGQRQLPFLQSHLLSLLPYLLKEHFSMNCQFTDLARLTRPVNPRDSPAPPYQCWELKLLMPHSSFAWVLGIHMASYCVTSTLATKSYFHTPEINCITNIHVPLCLCY